MALPPRGTAVGRWHFLDHDGERRIDEDSSQDGDHAARCCRHTRVGSGLRRRHEVDRQHNHDHDDHHHGALDQRDADVPGYGPRSSAERTGRLRSSSQLLGPGFAVGPHGQSRSASEVAANGAVVRVGTVDHSSK